MGAPGTIIHYRLSALRRWAPASVGLVTLALWTVAVVRDGTLWLLPVALVASAALSLLALLPGVARAVAVGPDVLVIRTHRGTSSLSWPDIAVVEQRANAVWILARSGWYVLPLHAWTSPAGGGAGPPLGEAVYLTWVAARGAGWHPHELDPWAPRTDARGRVTLRGRFLSRLIWLGGFVGAILGTTLPPNRQAGTLVAAFASAAVLVAIVLAVTTLYHWWARVTIDDRGLTIRSGVRSTRVEWWQVEGFRETAGFAGRWHHLTLDHVEAAGLGDRDAIVRDGRIVRLAEPVTLPGPATSTEWWANDPDFVRVWAWLADRVEAQRRTAPLDPPASIAS